MQMRQAVIHVLEISHVPIHALPLKNQTMSPVPTVVLEWAVFSIVTRLLVGLFVQMVTTQPVIVTGMP